MTWEQIGLHADLVQRRQLELVDLVVGPLVASSGKKWKGYTTKRRRLVKGAPPKQDDAKLLAGLAALGLPVGVERPPKSGG